MFHGTDSLTFGLGRARFSKAMEAMCVLTCVESGLQKKRRMCERPKRDVPHVVAKELNKIRGTLRLRLSHLHHIVLLFLLTPMRCLAATSPPAEKQ